jgi:DNA modification methylase
MSDSVFHVYKNLHNSSRKLADYLDKERKVSSYAMLERTFHPEEQRRSFGLFKGDCLTVLDNLPPGGFQLAYIDPPFFTNKLFRRDEALAFDDRWGMNLQRYLDWIFVRLNKLPRVMRSTGTVFLHCDYHASHYLKVVMDRVFGYNNFVDEVIWKRQSAHNDVKQGSRHFGRIHDTILVYANSRHYKWNSAYEPYSHEYIEDVYRYTDEYSSRRYALGDLTGPGGSARYNPRFPFLGITRAWRYSQSRMESLLREGRIVQTRPGCAPRLKRYLDEMNGKPIQDIWDDISPVKSRSRENSNYPTQKPVRLLKRIIRVATDPGDTVLDLFCGSGTSGVASSELERNWVGIDTSIEALEITKARLFKSGIVAEITQ